MDMDDQITFSELFESSLDAILLVDENGIILKANHQTKSIFGYEKDEIEGMEIDQLIPPKHRPLHSNYFVEFLKKPLQMKMGEEIEIYGLSKDGSLCPIEIILSPIIQNNKNIIITSIRDISKRKQFEKEVKNRENQYRNLILNHPHGIIETLFDGTITIVNKAYARLYGLEIEELVGKKGWEITDDEKLRKEIKDFYTKTKDGEVVPETRIEERKTGDGNTIHIQIDWDYRIDSAGEKIGHTIVVTDVTKYKKIENDLLISKNRLRALSANLQDKIEDERRRIAREIHDELGQALTAINMELDFLIDDLEEKDGLTAEKLIDNLHSIGELIDRLIVTVQNISTELRPDLLDHLGLYAAIEWQLKEFEKRFNIKTEINDFNDTLNLNDEQNISIYRIFQETLTNIARHSSANAVNVNFELIKNYLELRITDNGIGIDKQILNDMKSIGILGIMERVHILGGEISIDNAPHGGTEVYLKVPLK